MNSILNKAAVHTEIFDQIAKLCPAPTTDISDVITVLIDEQHILGKYFKQLPDRSIEKHSAVAVVRGIACQYYVPDCETLQKLLTIVSGSSYAAIINAGWNPVHLGERFVFLSKMKLEEMGLEPEAITTVDGMTAFARIKEHSTPSTWQLLDRDEDVHTPDWACKQTFSEWRQNLDKILPGVGKVKMLRAHSSSSRVLYADGSAVGGGNGHVWIKIKDASDAERSRTAIIARAIEFGLAWTKPRISKKTGQECGRGYATITDQSVFTPGRPVFAGCPTCSSGLKVSAQKFELIAGEDDALDTSQAVINVLKTFRCSTKKGMPIRLSRSGKGYSTVMYNLTHDTEIELENGSIITMRDLMPTLVSKVRCQSPFRASTSMAAFAALDGNGDPFVFDSGTNTTHRLIKQILSSDIDKDRDNLIHEVKVRTGKLVGEDNVSAVLNEDVIRIAWDATFCIPTNNKVGILNKNNELVELSAAETKQFGLSRSFGRVYNTDMLDEVIAEMALSQQEESALRKSIAVIEHGPFLEYIKLVKQAKSLDVKVDIFSQRANLTVADGIAMVTLPHRCFKPKANIEQLIVDQVVADYIEHCPEFPDLLALILHARFATDRRHAFVWLHSPSSWGKGFLIAIFAHLGLVVEVSASEIEKALAGGPVGLSLTDALRAWIMFVDEFKSASSELKLLNTQMQISPKNQLRCKIQLYTKLFASAESARSLVGDGIESQFNNRFAYLSPSTHDQKLEDRQLFRLHGKSVYINAMVKYVADCLNAEVQRMVALGATEASKIADRFIEVYQSERRLNVTFGNLDDSVEDAADQIRNCLIEYARWNPAGNACGMIPDAVQGLGLPLLNTLKRTAIIGYVCEGNSSKRRLQAIVLGDPVPFIKGYLALSGDRSTIGKMQYKADEIATKLHERTEPHGGRVRVYESDGKTDSKQPVNKRGVVVFIPDIPQQSTLTIPATVGILKKAKLDIKIPHDALP